jgi:hypothetical protein
MVPHKQIFESVLEGASGYIVTIRFSITPLSDVILPPMTSKLLKHIVLSSDCLSDIHGFVRSRASIKPVTLFALRRGSRRLYSTLGSEEPLRVHGGEVLEGRVALYSRNPFSISALSGCEGVVEFLGYKFAFSTREAVIEGVEGLDAGIARGKPFKLVIHTPLLLPTKIMTPPPLTSSKLVSSIKPGYRLLPTPSYIMAAACREWLGLVKGERVEGHIAPYVVGRLADIAFYEVDINIRPTTTVYGRDERDRLQLVRGVTGYIAYTITTRRLEKTANKLLALATRIGLGKSRSIGFGEVEVREFTTKPTSSTH